MAADVRNNYKGNITTTEVTLFTSPTGRRTIVTGIRFANPGTTPVFGEARVEGVPVFVGMVPEKEGIYDKDTRLEVLPGQKLSVKADAAGLQYFVSVVEVDN